LQSAFWGLPRMVQALPMFAAAASAIKSGTGGRFRRRATRTRSGVNIRQMVSFMKTADSAPAEKTAYHNRPRALVARRRIARSVASKNPDNSR
jgi:hypothetical protein